MILAVAALQALLIYGCRWVSPEVEVEVALPDLPSAWGIAFPSGGWTILIPREGRGIDRFAFALERGRTGGPEQESVRVSPGDEGTIIRLPKGRNVPVLAFIDECMLPAGGIYPLDLDDAGLLPLRWEKGPLAVVLAGLTEADWEVDVLNAGRLGATLVEKGGGDPWLVDLDLVVGTLWFGTFSSSRLRKLTEYCIDLPAGVGRWIPDDPFRRPVDAAYDGIIYGCPVREGYSRFLNLDTGSRVRVYVEDGRWAIFKEPAGR